MMNRGKYPRVSELMVLESAGGFYIGRVYKHSEDEYEPYSRHSTYMVDRETAENSLADNTYIEHFNEY